MASFQPDYMGWIFVPSSPRMISADRALRLIPQIRTMHPEIQHVAVLGGMGQDRMIRLIQLLGQGGGPFPVDIIQLIGSSLHIEHTRSILKSLNIDVPLWPVFRADGPVSDEDLASLARSDMYVVDRRMPHALGGTGKQVDVTWLDSVRYPFLLAGGLNPENALDACLSTTALGVDISSGLETEEAGRKDPQKLEALFRSFGRD